MSRIPLPKSLNSKKTNRSRRAKLKNSTKIITVRIEEDLNENIDRLRKK
ncbi:MAG: hypothetical protein Lokiarch_09820, partial [Candidatus Lokiarchaeum sp. GC14_75]